MQSWPEHPKRVGAIFRYRSSRCDPTFGTITNIVRFARWRVPTFAKQSLAVNLGKLDYRPKRCLTYFSTHTQNCRCRLVGSMYHTITIAIATCRAGSARPERDDSSITLLFSIASNVSSMRDSSPYKNIDIIIILCCCWLCCRFGFKIAHRLTMNFDPGERIHARECSDLIRLMSRLQIAVQTWCNA